MTNQLHTRRILASSLLLSSGIFFKAFLALLVSPPYDVIAVLNAVASNVISLPSSN